MALPKNRKAVGTLLGILEPRILGKEQEGFTCSCGAVHCARAVAEKIVPAGDSYPGQEVNWALWTVRMKAHGGGSGWSCGLSRFVEAKELEAMFKKYFGTRNDECRLYKLDVDGVARVYQGLPAAVRIQENDSQTRFSFSWGREQNVAKRLDELGNVNPRRMPAGSKAYVQVVSIMETILPEVYRGGPDPELPCESTWHLDYLVAMAGVKATAHHIFFQNGDVTYSGRGTTYAHLDVVFMKHAVN